MSETGLLIAQAALIVVLYAFIWLVVRSAGKQVGVAAPPPPRPAVVPDDAVTPAYLDLDHDLPHPEWEPDLLEVRGAPVAPPPEEIPLAPELSEETEAPAADAAPEEESEVTAAAEEPDDDGPRGAFALTDSSHPRLVVERSPVLADGTEFTLEGGMTIGRSPSSGVLIDDDFVSHMHARVMRRGEFYFISDLGSTNGTQINGRPIDEDRQLRVRDEIQVGETVLRYEE